MFSGIIEEAAEVVSIETARSPFTLFVRSGADHSETGIGDSVAVSGCCLTVVAIERELGGETVLKFELAEETLRRTAFRDLRPHSRVNLERSLQLGDRLHGHLVTGHVDAVGTLVSRRTEETSEQFIWSFPRSIAPYIAEKGSLSIAGVSLTVGKVSDSMPDGSPGGTCETYLIPHTLSVTTFGEMQPGALVNLEIDLIARYVRRNMAFLTASKVAE
jgi:riboflavin synthase